MASIKIKSNSDEDSEHLGKIFPLNHFKFTIKSAFWMPGSEIGDNYMSVVKRVYLDGVLADVGEKTCAMIVKRQIPSRSRRQLFRCDQAFYNEIAAYNKVVPMLENYMPLEPVFPKCYFTGVDKLGEIIILDDLKEQNYFLHDRSRPFDLEHCKLVMRALAKLHAFSIGAKFANEEEFKKNIKCLNEIVYSRAARKVYKQIVEIAIQQALECLKKLNDKKLKEPIKKIKRLKQRFFKKIKSDISKKNDNSVICHGDLWMNNIMFKSDAVTGKPIAVKFIDLQAMRFASPVYDLLHFFYTSTKRSLRNKHLKKILKTYCKEVRRYIDQQKCDNDDINRSLNNVKGEFTLSKIFDEFRSKILYGLVVGAWILPAITFDPKNLPNLDILGEMNQNKTDLTCTQKLTPEYQLRIKDLALEFHNRKFLEPSFWK